MKIVSVTWDEEIKSLVKEVFAQEGFPKFFENCIDDYLFYLLRHIAARCKEEASVAFRKEMMLLAINAHNRIHYSMQLGSDRCPIDDD